MPGDRDRPFACEKCFADHELIEWIRDNGAIGNCSWCRARHVHVVNLAELAPHFREVADMYEECHDLSGDSLAALLQDNWEIFSTRIVGKHQIVYGNALLDEMVTAILRADLSPKEVYEIGQDYTGWFRRPGGSLEVEWEERVAEFIGAARMLQDPAPAEGTLSPSSEASVASSAEPAAAEDRPRIRMEPIPADLDVDRLEFAIEDMARSFSPQEDLYRARIHDDPSRHERFGVEDMGAPPAHLATCGRANRAGQPVLYLATDTATALAEKRAWKGTVVAVAKMRLTRDVHVLDLTNLKPMDSPFFLDGLRWRVEAVELFGRFAYELSRPLLPGEPDSHYAPTQHICELVRRAGFDGIVYPSAMGRGHNLVLFAPTAGEAIEVEYVEVGRISYETEPINAKYIYLDAWPWEK